jgi:6-pyruvoyltetrahydropterin/6-carboxytetrahydropterin synthase
MFEVSVEHTFAAGHSLRNYRGKCENVHGHNYRIVITVAGEELNSTGLLLDFVELKKRLRAISDRLDHQFINDIEPFTTLNPSAENMAKYFYDELSEGLSGEPGQAPVRIAEVRVWETDTSVAAGLTATVQNTRHFSERNRPIFRAGHPGRKSPRRGRPARMLRNRCIRRDR